MKSCWQNSDVCCSLPRDGSSLIFMNTISFGMSNHYSSFLSHEVASHIAKLIVAIASKVTEMISLKSVCICGCLLWFTVPCNSQCPGYPCMHSIVLTLAS